MKPSLLQVIDRMEELVDEDYRENDHFEDYSKLEDHSKYYEGEDNLRWMWEKGVNLGKKMVVTGVVVSSASFVLPSLVVITAIGFAFSLPAGLMFATYACTDKLMNTLLPIPTSSPHVEFEAISCDEDDEVDKGYEEDDEDDVLDVEKKEFEEDTRKEIENRIELGDDGENMGTEDQNLDSSVIPDIMEGIREAEDDLANMGREGVEKAKDSLSAVVVEAEIGGRNENNVEDVTEELVFGSPWGLAEVDENEVRKETTALLEKLRDEGRDDSDECRQKDDSEKGKHQENELPVIHEEEEVTPSSRSIGSNDSNESGIGEEHPQVVVKRTVVVNVTASGDRTATEVHEGTVILSEVAALEMADESGVDQSTDLLNKGEDFASESSFGANVDYHEVRIESIPAMSRHAETVSDKERINEEKLWHQIHAMRTIIGYKTEPHASYVDELEALYEFTGVELPISSKDAPDLADVNEKLHSLMTIIGVK